MTFVNVMEADVWCSCGRVYSILGSDEDVWTEVCPNCGERVEFTFKFRVLEEGNKKVEVEEKK